MRKYKNFVQNKAVAAFCLGFFLFLFLIGTYIYKRPNYQFCSISPKTNLPNIFCRVCSIFLRRHQYYTPATLALTTEGQRLNKTEVQARYKSQMIPRFSCHNLLLSSVFWFCHSQDQCTFSRWVLRATSLRFNIKFKNVLNKVTYC